MATVYLARDLKHDRPVALKVMRAELAATLGPERFLREIRTTARLEHPHILTVLDSGADAGRLWYTMPYVRGETLRERLRRETQLPIEAAVDLARQIASALDHAHREGIVHRDLKPENILLADGQARVADFGVATAVSRDGDDRITEAGLAVGTPAYMSPEQAAGGPADPRSDVYALGCVLYEMLAGEPPHTGPTPQAILARRLTDPPPALRQARDGVPPAIDAAVHRALARIPADRFATAGEFARVLDARDAREATQTLPQHRALRRFRLAVGLAAAVLALGAALVWRSRAGDTALHDDLLAVAPFDVLDPRLQLWREGLVDLLSRNLDGAGPLRAVAPTTVIRRWQGRADELSATELGKRTGARLLVYGSLVPAGADSARIRATLLDVASRQVLADLELRGAVSRMDRLSDSLSVRLLAGLARHRRIELTQVASLGSTSPTALKAFLQGEQSFRLGRWDSALAAYSLAVETDSGFALAWWRLSRVIAWRNNGDDSEAVAAGLRAGALNHGLAPRDSLLLAVDSQMQGVAIPSWSQYRRMHATARAAVQRYPDDADAWQTLGEVYDHYGLYYGAGLDTSLAAFERAIALDSAYAPAYIHAMELASWAHGIEPAMRYAAAFLRRAPDGVTADGVRLALDLAGSGPGTQPPALRRASTNVRFKALLAFFGAVDTGETTARAARALAAAPAEQDPWLPPPFRRALLFASLTYRGHLAEAGRAWSTELAFPGYALTDFCMLGYPLPEGAAAYLKQRVAMGDLLAGAGLPCWTAAADTAAILAYGRLADSVRRAGTDAGTREPAIHAAATAAAFLALARRDTADALRRFNALPDSFCYACSYPALTRLALRAAQGRHRAVLEDPGPWTSWPSALHVLGRLEQARAAERLGARERAARGYQFVADAWRRADPELQPYVAEAQAGLERLSGESSP